MRKAKEKPQLKLSHLKEIMKWVQGKAVKTICIDDTEYYAVKCNNKKEKENDR